MSQTHAGLAYPNAEKVSKSLSHLLADTFVLYVKTLNFHWNFQGPQFLTLHEYFEGQYETLAKLSDELAERIRQLGVLAPGSLEQFKQLTQIKESESNLSADKMIKILAEDHLTLTRACQEAMKVSDEDEVTKDMLIQQSTFHDKSVWILGTLQHK